MFMKQAILFLALFISAVSFGQQKVTAPLVRNAPTDTTYAILADTLLHGGHQFVNDTLVRNTIPIAARKKGMWVTAANTGVTYKLSESLGDWSTVIFGADSSVFATLFKVRQDSITNVANVALKENLSNKVNVITTPNSADYPTTAAVNGFVASSIAGKTDTSKTRADSTILRGIINNYIDTTVLFSKLRGFAKFQTKLSDSINNRKINVRLIGTSISQGNSYANIFLKALENKYGKSNSIWSPFAKQANQNINGWKTQYYGGLYTIRMKGRSDSASAYTFYERGKNIVIYYSKDTDGGTVSVAITSTTGTTNYTFDCNGAKSYGSFVVLPLNQYQDNLISITAPASGYGYLETYVINSIQQGGIFQFNASYGGSGIGNAAGTWQRTPTAGMYPTDVPTGNIGLATTFAPTDSFYKPDLLVYSGFTNDFNYGLTDFTNSLTTAVDLAVANGSSVILCIEPVNGQASVSTWATFRKVYYDLAKKYPENVSVYDWELLMSPSLTFNPKYHSTNLSDPHPGDFGFGNPHAIGGADFAKTYGIVNDITYINNFIEQSLSNITVSDKEPLYAPLGSWWVDTSVSVYLNKKLISRPILGRKGVWETSSGLNKNIQNGLPQALYGAFTNDTSSLNIPCVAISSTMGYIVARTNFTVGKTYTISFDSELTSKASLFTVGVSFGNNPFYILDASVTNLFKVSASQNIDVVYSEAGVKKNIYTFKMPSDAEITAAGVSLSGNGGFLTIRISNGVGGAKTRIWDFKIEEGASATNFLAPYIYQIANSISLSSANQPLEPNTNTYANGSGWIDSSNTVPSYKVLFEKQTVRELGIVQPANVWQQAVPNVNLVNNLIATTAALTMSNGGSITKTNDGLNGTESIKIVTTTGNANNTAIIYSGSGQAQMAVNQTYTLSFLVKSYVNDFSLNSANLQFYTNLSYYNGGGSILYLDAAKIIQTTNQNLGIIYATTVSDGNFYRVKLTFKMGSTLPGPIASNQLQIRITAYNNTAGGGSTYILSDFKLEQGAGVTNSSGASNIGFAPIASPAFTGTVTLPTTTTGTAGTDSVLVKTSAGVVRAVSPSFYSRLSTSVIGGSISTTVTAITTFIPTIPTQANNTYQVVITPSNSLTATPYYVTNKTTTSFDVVFTSPLTGTVAFDWVLKP